MIDRSTHYVSGNAIRAGDRICYANTKVVGTILFVLGQAECVHGHEEDKTWFETQETRGFVFDCEPQGRVYLEESDEDFELLGRQDD